MLPCLTWVGNALPIKRALDSIEVQRLIHGLADALHSHSESLR